MSEAMSIGQIPSAATSPLNVAMVCMNENGDLSKLANTAWLFVDKTSGMPTNLDELTMTGLYYVRDAEENPAVGRPSSCNGSFVLVMRADTANIHQVMFNRMDMRIYYRMKMSGTWKAWAKMAVSS